MTSTRRRRIMVGRSGDPNQSAPFRIDMATASVKTDVSDPKVVLQHQYLVIQPSCEEREEAVEWTGIARRNQTRTDPDFQAVWLTPNGCRHHRSFL